MGTRTQNPLRERGNGGPQVLAIFENKQSPTGSQVFNERLLNGKVLALLDVGGSGKCGDGGTGFVHRGKLSYVHLVVDFVP